MLLIVVAATAVTTLAASAIENRKPMVKRKGRRWALLILCTSALTTRIAGSSFHSGAVKAADDARGRTAIFTQRLK
ncbi:hypothetical protein VRZ08_04520 [Rhodopseudomonas sp. G2_2311]